MQLFDADMSSKTEDMYRSRFLCLIRNTKYGADTFVCGRACVEMRKSTVYKVDIKLDVCGVLQESQYGCGAGKGPEANCKHLRSGGSLQRVLDLDPSPGDDMPDSEYETFSGM
ncbi:hypothetical protein LSH36_2084g00002 [Paralvinella palmiformis]|uniref:Uncharacterized protein n=1 Tax=Paralvinella palmiformis TaxID=53620 RepID=A0AAD9MQC1_9ANNE|nr:hypothetical protein LSH36_2084g00002 [Paralvinella palmiformis]